MTHPDIDALGADDPSPETVAHVLGCYGCRRDRAAWRGDDGEVDVRLSDATEPDRFEILGWLGTGGTSTVILAFDRVLEREVAIKIPLPSRDDEFDAILAEARRIAALEHPSIIAVHHFGRLRDGRMFYAMKVARGHTLRSDLAAEDTSPLRLRRLVAVLLRVAEGAAFVHAHGVVHRDLKPENVGIGLYDEVTLLDFGLSRPPGEGARPAGTPPYAAPEVGAGAAPTPANDVYAIGVMLREIVGRAAPFVPDQHPLGALAARWAHADPASRPSTAQVVDELRDWLDGARRVDEADQLVADAGVFLAEAQRQRTLAATLGLQAATELLSLPANADPEEKRGAWAKEDAAQQALIEAEGLEVRYEHQLAAALRRWPDHAPARLALAEHWRGRLVDAEHRREPKEIARYTALVREDGTFAAWLEAATAVTVVTDPPGMAVVAQRFERVGRRLEPTGGEPLGETPLGASLAPGSWRLVLSDGASLPVLIERGGDDPGLTPEGDPVVHRPPNLDADRECWVPAGWAVIGGDDHAPDAFPRARVWVDAFVIQRFPVTAGEYVTFLNELRASGRADEADRCVPRHLEALEQPVFPHVDGAYRLPPGTGPDFPVVSVDLSCARAYARWRRERDGLPWRLPTEYEWEKAARGVDGRRWPWGDHFEPAWARTVSSRVRAPGLGPVGEYPDDESVYGVRGLAGGVRDWTASAWTAGPTVSTGARAPLHDETGAFQVSRGGSWTNSSGLCRPATRFGSPPSARFVNTGFRLARSVG